MKKKLRYKDWQFEVDYNRTKEIYAKIKNGRPEGCDCNHCRNFSANRETIYPMEFKNLLEELGLDYKKEPEIYHMYKLENGKHFYGGWFHFKGQILDVNNCNSTRLNGMSTSDTIMINEDFKLRFKKGSDLSFFDKKEKENLIQIDFFANSDWVIAKELESE